LPEGVFPPAFIEKGGVKIPHIPTIIEMEECAIAEEANVACPRKEEIDRMVVLGEVPIQLINCSTCPYRGPP